MDNTQVFTAFGYDMVVAVTQKSINDQLKHLAGPDVHTIKTTLIIEMGADPKNEDNWLPIIHETWDSVPKDINGLPVNPSMNATYLPSIDIKASGTVIHLILSFKSGKLYLRNQRTGNMSKGLDMAGWVYGIAIGLDFAEIERDQGLAAPQRVIDQIQHFTTDQFRVSQLFLNFEDTNLMRFDPSVTSVANSGTLAMEQFTFFMSTYLGAFKSDPKTNPFILGYTITRTPQTVVDKEADKKVPDTLKPIGNTFTLYQDTTHPELSTVNFVMNTAVSGGKNGPGRHPTPGNFSSNWLSSTEVCDGKMIYSSFCLLETIILRPFYETYSKNSHDLVSKHLSLGGDADYDHAKTIRTDDGKATGKVTGFDYWIHNTMGTDDEYQNHFSANWSPTTTGVVIDLVGSIHIKKTNNTDLGLGNTATSWVSVDETWKSAIHLDIAYNNDAQQPFIKASNPTIITTSYKQGDHQNDWAKFMGPLGKVFGGLLDLFTAFQDNNAMGNMFGDSWGAHINGIPPVNVAMDNLFDATHSTFLLPAGDVFFFKSIGILPSGPTELEVVYKSETGGSKPVPTAETHVVANQVSRVLALGSAPEGFVREPMRVMRDKPLVVKSVKVEQSVKAANLELNGINGAKAVEGVSVQGFQPPADTSSPPTTSGAPILDRFSLERLNKTKDKEVVDVSVSSELMHNSHLGLPVSPSEDMCVIQDSAGLPYILTIGTDQRLNLLVSSSGTSTSGWSTINILDSFPAYTTAAALDVVQDSSGKVSVALALRKEKSEQSDVFFASMLPNDTLAATFGKLSSIAKQVTGLDAGFITEKITLGSSDDGKVPILIVEGSINSVHFFYQIASDTLQAQKNEFVEQVKAGKESLIHHCLGFSFGQRANCFLYAVNGARHLAVQTIADDSGGSIAFDYSPGNMDLPQAYRQLDYNTIATVTSRPDPDFAASDLYIGARTGIYRIPNGKHADMELVSDQIQDIHEITAAINGNDISLWVAASPNKLYYIYGKRTADTSITWNMPVLFAADVVTVASMRSTSKNANEIFVLTQNMALTHYWQDPKSTMWRSQTSNLSKDKYVLNFDSYTTHVHLESKGLPVPDKFRITSGEWQYCTINGLVYSLDQDTPAEIVSDEFGNITIISSAVDISPAVLHIQSDLFAETINIYPGGKIHAGLQAINSGDGLTKTVTQDGQPLLGKDVSPDTADGIAAQISALHSAADKQFPPSMEGKTFVALQKPSNSGSGPIKHLLQSKLSTDHLPSGFAMGGVFKNGVMEMHTPQSANSLLHVSRVALFSFSDITHVAGDVWHHIEQLGDIILSAAKSGIITLSDGISFIISKAGDLLHFVLNIAGQTITIVLDTFVQVYKAMYYVFKLIGIGLREFLKWLGHLLGWDHIWNTHKMIAGSMRGFIDFAAADSKKYIEIARSTVKTAFADFDKMVKNVILPDHLKSSTAIQAASQANNADNTGASMNSPQANFAAYHFAHSGKDSQPSNATVVPAKPVNPTISNPVTQFYDDVIKPVATVLFQKLGQDGTGLVNLIKNRDMDSLRVLIADMADTIISVIAALVDGLLHFIEDAIGDLQALLTEEWDIPIISQLYEFVTGLLGDSEKFTIINGLAFLIAIPAVVIMKIAGVGYPEDHNAIGMDQPGFSKKLEGLVHEQNKPAKMLMAVGPPNRSLAAHGVVRMAISDDQKAALAPYSALAGLVASLMGVYGNVKDIRKNPSADIAPIDVPVIPTSDKSKMAISFFKGAFGAPMPNQTEPVSCYVLRWFAALISTGWDIASEGLQANETVKEKGVIIQAVIDLVCSGISIGINYAEQDTVIEMQWIADLCSNWGSLVHNLGEAGMKKEDPELKSGGLFASKAGSVACATGSITGIVFACKALGNSQTWRVINVGGG